MKLQHVSVFTGPSSGSTSSQAKVTAVYYFSRYTYIGAVEACFLVLSYACVFLLTLDSIKHNCTEHVSTGKHRHNLIPKSMLPQHQYKCNVKNSTLW